MTRRFFDCVQFRFLVYSTKRTHAHTHTDTQVAKLNAFNRIYVRIYVFRVAFVDFFSSRLVWQKSKSKLDRLKQNKKSKKKLVSLISYLFCLIAFFVLHLVMLVEKQIKEQFKGKHMYISSFRSRKNKAVSAMLRAVYLFIALVAFQHSLLHNLKAFNKLLHHFRRFS